jgi:hypothetical protein
MKSPERQLEIESALQAFAAAGAERGLIYLSTPITTGRRELELMSTLGAGSREELRRCHADRWLSQVVQPNERDCLLQAELVTQTVALGRLVVNPARMKRPAWDQEDYDRLWAGLISEFPVTVLPLDGWEYSRGARLEVALALRLGAPVIDIQGRPLSAHDLVGSVAEADRVVRDNNWGGRDVPLPALLISDDTEARPGVPTKPPEEDEVFARAVFSWLIRERNYQLAKFGTALDDVHTSADGVSVEGWWGRQLAMYFHRAGVLGLENANGRQALGKYVATACGMLESVTRVYGPLPAPNVPSGDIRPGPAGVRAS